jgi:oligopeptide transport system ATP-binding protein
VSDRVIDVRDLTITFPGPRTGLIGRRRPVTAVDRVSFQLRRGEALGVVGESGAGKTTMLRALAGLVTPSSGSVSYQDVDLTELRGAERKRYLRHVHVVFQNPYTAFHPRMTIGEALAEPLAIHGIGEARSRRERIADALRQVGLDPAFVSRYPHQFSGGQRQRLAIARALVLGADVLLADEPVSALDVSIQAQVLNLLQDLKERLGLTYVVVAHDLAVVRYLCDRVAVMVRGRFVEVAGNDSLYARPRHPYTRALLEAVPSIRRGLLGEELATDPAAYEGLAGALHEVEPGHLVAL